MTTNRFRSVALALRDHISDTYALLAAADAIVALDNEIERVRPVIKTPDGTATWNWDLNLWKFNHDALVSIALNTHEVLGSMRENKKINAIKALRSVAKCGLKEAKEAVEDRRVSDALVDPWSQYSEPPF